MLQRLYVKNVALIKEADIEFDSGLNVLSGETGAGKSVILDSINFVLGSKADKTMIRYGERDAFVKAEFSVNKNSEAVKLLSDYDIESDGEIIISRKFGVDGKNSIKINGNTVTVSMLKSLTAHLVDVHGQSEHFFLLNENNQLKVIDNLLGNSAEVIKADISSLLSKKKEYKEKISAFGGSEAERERKLDLLNFQIKEIENADIRVGELDELTAYRNKILNVEKILYAVSSAKSILSDDGGVSDGLFSASREIGKISNISDEYDSVCQRIENLNSEISDLSETLSDIADSLTFDGQEARRVEERIELIKSLSKKYGPDEAHIIEFCKKAKEEYESVSDSADLIEKYEKFIDDCDENLFDLCCKLTEMRKRFAKAFCIAVENELKTLNIPNAVFNVKFNNYTRDSAKFQTNGSDEISFEFSANKGEPLKPLSKVISGGEMSRFMLAIKTQLKNINGISTYIFDEIDAGISGYTADSVAKKFQKIANTTQIIAVSHLPQICAASDTQFLIYKTEENEKTYSNIEKLGSEQKIGEIVRLMGNVRSESAIHHAEELIDHYKN